ncbi:MAG: hypothetical protein KKD01_01235 [Proteobacteria bacterium]|nr:hypothetical protein [Pseudomonadota bacterium]MBU1418273.1 hypothetical protein [Pseudomonadota bacterium]MBU1453323.1 hypothetical protein [Pseudomonadota bacterium]
MIRRELKPGRDYEVMDDVLKRGDAKELARQLSCSPQLIRSWCRAPETADDFSTGKFGPLARLRTLIAMVKDDDGIPDRAFPIGQYIARQLGGVFVPLPLMCNGGDSELMNRVSDVLKETAQAIEEVRAAWCEKSPGKIDQNEGLVCRNEIDEAIGAMVQLRNWLDEKENKS